MRPHWVKTYYQLTKPGIIYGNVMTAAAGYLLGAKRHIDFGVLAALLAGTALIIASACVFNNYIDRGIDSQMARTKKRALASGKISALNALVYAVVLGILGFAILTRTNTLVMIIGFAAIFSYDVLYGIAKRKSIHGTLVGTIPGAASLVAGYTAATNQLNLATLILFLIMLCWQMAHFYSIAIFRADEYKAAKIPVMPVVVGIKKTKLQIIIYVFAFVICSTLLSVLGYAGLVYLVAVASVGLYWLYKGISGFGVVSSQKWARGMFGFSLVTLLVFSAMLATNAWLP